MFTLLIGFFSLGEDQKLTSPVLYCNEDIVPGKREISANQFALTEGPLM